MVSTSFCDLMKYVAFKSKPGSSLDVLLNQISLIKSDACILATCLIVLGLERSPLGFEDLYSSFKFGVCF